jgi:hypothetical protein
MEENKQQGNRSGTDKSQRSDEQSPKQDISRQHKTGDDNPQTGSAWDNYQTRTLSGNKQEREDPRDSIL